MASISRVIREERRRLGLTQAELASKLEVSQATVSRWEQGTQTPDFASFLKLSDVMEIDAVKLSLELEREEHPYSALVMWAQEVRIIGGIASGRWVEQVEWEENDQFDLQIPPMKHWEDGRYEGFVVQDNSCAPKFEKDSIVFCAVDDTNQLNLENDDVVVVFRKDERGLFEVSLKQVYMTADNRCALLSIGDEETFRDFLLLVPDDKADRLGGSEVTRQAIRGIVVASYRPESAGRRGQPSFRSE